MKKLYGTKDTSKRMAKSSMMGSKKEVKFGNEFAILSE